LLPWAFKVPLLLGYDGRAPLDNPSTARQLSHEITDDKQSEGISWDMSPDCEGGSALHNTRILLPQVLPWNEKTAPQGGQFGLLKPYA
jgi:hypothetical protein